MHCRTSIQNTREFRSETVHKMSSEQVTQRSSSQGAALPRPRRDTANAHAILQSYYTTWVNEIWNTTFKERRWGRGGRKPNKRDILLSAKNQEGKGKKKNHHNHLSISHGGLVALAPGLGHPGGDRSSAVPLHRDVARKELGLWLALPWLPAPPQSSSKPPAPGEETSTLLP